MEEALREARTPLTWRQISRTIQTIAVPVLLSIVVNYFVSKKQPEVPPALYLPLLKDIGFTPRTYPVTYRLNAVDFHDYQRIQNVTTNVPDTTAVLLNWARFPNVLLITSLLCGAWLDDTIAGVVIWNNSPTPLTYEDLKHTGCSRDKLYIHNAPGNTYFQGRFMGCAAAKTPYCYVQDDDYLIRAEIIRTLRSRISDANGSHAIHLLPPHEHLSTSLREIHVPKPDESYLSDIHTSFAWLGHGTLMHRHKADEFLSLMRYLRASPNEMKMADNYFTILSNVIPETWFDQDFGLGGGNAFTVGEEGHQRNMKHILRATQYLDSLASCGAASCESEAQAKPIRMKIPYTSLSKGYSSQRPWNRAACRGASCVLETNVKLFPDTVTHVAGGVRDILSLEERNLAAMGWSVKQTYQDSPLSHAVDTRPDTAFRSFKNALRGDMIILDLLGDISNVHDWRAAEMVWLVNNETEEILRASAFESSTDNETWRQALHQPVCHDVNPPLSAVSDDDGKMASLRECSIRVAVTSSDLHLHVTGRYFRARVEEDQQRPWTVYEVWLRGL